MRTEPKLSYRTAWERRETHRRISVDDSNEIIPGFRLHRRELPALIDYWTMRFGFWEARVDSDEIPVGMLDVRKGEFILERLHLSEASLDHATFNAAGSSMERVRQPATEHCETHEPISADDCDESVRGFEVLRCELSSLVEYWTERLLFWDWQLWLDAALSMCEIRWRDFILARLDLANVRLDQGSFNDAFSAGVKRFGQSVADAGTWQAFLRGDAPSAEMLRQLEGCDLKRTRPEDRW
jgi:hypothetical protein